MLNRLSFLGLCLGLLALAGVSLATVAHAQDSNKEVSGDHAVELEKLRPLAESGHAEAQYELGLRYGLGEGVEQSYDSALEWFGRAKEQGHPLAGEFVMGINECRRLNGCWATDQLTTQLDIDSNT